MYGTHPIGQAGPWKKLTADAGSESPTTPPLLVVELDVPPSGEPPAPEPPDPP
jgi:hypothetical protein